jgi:hypothetical protein
LNTLCAGKTPYIHTTLNPYGNEALGDIAGAIFSQMGKSFGWLCDRLNPTLLVFVKPAGVELVEKRKVLVSL